MITRRKSNIKINKTLEIVDYKMILMAEDFSGEINCRYGRNGIKSIVRGEVRGYDSGVEITFNCWKNLNA